MKINWMINMLQRKGKDLSPYVYKGSILSHHALQSLLGLVSPSIKIQYERQKIYFIDGGHISLDWINKYPSKDSHCNVPVLLLAHGMTGASETQYIKIIADKAKHKGFTFACLNNRGFNSIMSSPVPFIGLQFHQLQAALKRVQFYYPNRPLHLIGMSLGGNHLLRYLIKNRQSSLLSNLESLSLVSPPFDLKHVLYNMNPYYQRLFVKFYIKQLVLKHQQMQFWSTNGLVDFQHMQKSTTLIQFHQRITQKIVGQPIDQFLQRFTIDGKDIQKLQVKTLILSSKDDPMVHIQTLPIDSIKKNKEIKLILTESGAHVCWYQGMRPVRWYPKPMFQFIQDIQKGKKVSQI